MKCCNMNNGWCGLVVPDFFGLDVGLVSTDSFPFVVAVGSMMSELSSESIVCMILCYQSMLVFLLSK